MTTAQRVPVGLVTGAFGADGELRVRWLGDGPQTLLDAATVWLAREESDPLPRRHSVRAADVLGGDEVRMHVAGLRDRSSAEACKSCLVLIDTARLEPLGDDEYYWHQLVGCRVDSTEGETLGTVTSLWETGSHDVLVVERAPTRVSEEGDSKPYLIPTAREFVTEIDLEARRVVVHVIPGLLEE